MPKRNRNIRGWIIFVFSILIVFIVLPSIIWVSCLHNKNLSERGKEGIAIVLEVKGFNRDKITFKYEVNGKEIEKTRHIPPNHKIKQGDKLKIVYDSLSIETVMIVW